MMIRDAKVTDVDAISALINEYAELDRMLFRSKAYLFENLQMFKVAVSDEGAVVGCCALQVIWQDLAEIKSLAVDRAAFGRGIGRALAQACLEKGRHLGLRRVFTLTLEPAFFEKVGFTLVERGTLPMKVWSDCARCSKQDHCDEIAMIYSLE